MGLTPIHNVYVGRLDQNELVEEKFQSKDLCSLFANIK